ncbi:uncharacterized protein LAESUDRAFT_793099 [Laetiporus sulphureus 93-53]|uniref:HNH nuclease domain-containing protein n=1 Tax=Laetiporus sulphureus 93-53 TaxID=1314785 RepID=A0A165GE97_9APHY|nr:uncharacterized protein LAESUDRAFT_793099 [Laetiporus sulphureus 93-53]KZT10227.1 hypothetical protein LAESUDRAFT_793099 [Laetiporus sulphureus 93-53]
MIPATYPGAISGSALTQAFISDQLQKISNSPASTNEKNLLQATILYAPSMRGKLNIAWAVNDVELERLTDLAKYYWTNIIVPVRSAGGRTPAPSSHPFHDHFELTMTLESAKCLSTLKVRLMQALVCNGYKCVITGKVDSKHASQVTTLTGLDKTEAAHIMPFSLNNFEEMNVPMVCYNRLMLSSTAIWTALQTFSGHILDGLKGNGINSLENVLTLEACMHQMFSELVLALEPIEAKPNVYCILTWDYVTDSREFLPEVITLNCIFIPHMHGLVSFSPTWTTCHASICKVLHTSGHAKELDRILEDLDDGGISALSHDSSMADLLEVVLLTAVAVS